MHAQPARPCATVIAFPARAEAGRQPKPLSAGDITTSSRVVRLLRIAARDAQIAAPVDLDQLCAAGPSGTPALWALALVRTAARGARALVFHPDGARMISATECWLASLVTATAAGDGDSAAFLAGRFLAARDRRLALCFARRLVETLEARAAA